MISASICGASRAGEMQGGLGHLALRMIELI